MAGAIILAIIIVVAIPVALCMSGAVAAALLGWSLTDDAKTRHDGSELLDLNK
ncbi:MAG TPA: hypothetical protein VE575_15950 [Acidimicrobiales bacterium]|nr:hypothetical protein [Acidimicrobiales bacterium]